MVKAGSGWEMYEKLNRNYQKKCMKIWSCQKKAVLLQPISVERLDSRLAVRLEVDQI